MDIMRYKEEINFIIRDLEDLERGDFSEKTGDKTSGSAINKAKNLKIKFIKLVDKIENDKESMGEIVRTAFEEDKV